MMLDVSDIRHIRYINLETRPDRRTHVEAQLTAVGFGDRMERQQAVPMAVGAIGCTMSHLQALQHAKSSGWDHILVVEDGISFTDPKLFQEQLAKFLLLHGNDFQILLLGANNFLPYKPVDSTCVQVTHALTTTGYLVRSSYFDTLIANMQEGLAKLIVEPTNGKFAVDKYWRLLQRKHVWYLLVPLTVVQAESFSNIENAVANYGHLMLLLDKQSVEGAGLSPESIIIRRNFQSNFM